MVCRANTCKCAFLFKFAESKDIIQDIQKKKKKKKKYIYIYIKVISGNKNFEFSV